MALLLNNVIREIVLIYIDEYMSHPTKKKNNSILQAFVLTKLIVKSNLMSSHL